MQPMSRWLGRCVAAVWLLAVALWVQFAVASVEEKEPQAVALGAIVAAMLIVVGLTLWGAKRRTHGR